jgi:UPF0716 protein FxsA
MPALLVLAFLAVPILELYVILQVAEVIGGWQTLAVLVAESVVGTWLVKREGRRTWQAFSTAIEQHRPPGREVADGVLVIIGGTLLLTPGFLSDVFGFLLLLPLTRPLARGLLMRAAARRAGRRLGMPFGIFGPGLGFGSGPGSYSGQGPRPRRRPGPGRADVIDGEVLDERPAGPGRVDLDKGRSGGGHPDGGRPNSGTPPRP